MSKPWFPMKGSATWKHKTGNDGYDDIYSSSTISCDLVFASHVVRLVTGDEVKCDAIITCVEAITSGDQITINGRDWPVLGTLSEGKDNNRVVQWRKVALGGAVTGV